MAKRAKRVSASDLSGLPAAVLELELNRRRKAGSSLMRKRAKLMEKVAAIDAQLGMIPAAGGKRTRPRNDKNLIESLMAVLKGKTLGVQEAVQAVQQAGYQSSSPNFRTMVNATLLKKKHFKRVSRGQYTAV